MKLVELSPAMIGLCVIDQFLLFSTQIESRPSKGRQYVLRIGCTYFSITVVLTLSHSVA